MHRQQNNGLRRKEAAQIILSLVIALMAPLQLASAQLSIGAIQQSNPVQLGSLQTMSVLMASNNTITQYLVEISGQNNTLERNGNNFTYSWQPQALGLNTYTLYFGNSEGETAVQASQFNVIDTVAPQITAIGPNNQTNSNPVVLSVQTSESATCKYDTLDMSYDSLRYSFTGSGLSHDAALTLSDGLYSYYARCKDSNQNQGASRRISFSLDTTAPQITAISPSGVQTQNPVYLRLVTTEPSTCKWSNAPQSYEAMPNTFQSTGSTLHEQPTTLPEGITPYYVICQDRYSNKNQMQTINLEINTPPKASITVEKIESYERLKTGTYTVKLVATEPLQAAPYLSLNCGPAAFSVPLEGSGTAWQGYLIVSPENFNCAAEFSYSGTDLRSTTGSEITSGKLVIIDSRKPPMPTSLKLENQENKIRLAWAEDSSEISHYNIYRSITGNTDKSNLKYLSQQTSYSDPDVQNKIGYFYRISAVSKSGMESDLSQEAFVMADLKTPSQPPKNAATIIRINSKAAEIEKTIQVIDGLVNKYTNADEAIKLVVEQKQTLDALGKLRGQVSSLIGELRQYQESDIGPAELDSIISAVDLKLKDYTKALPLEISLIQNTRAEQNFNSEAEAQALDAYLKNTALTAEQKEKYLVATKLLRDKYRVTQQVIIYKITYESMPEEQGTIINEKITLPEELGAKSIVQEAIPKGTLRLSEINFKIAPADINLVGPIWSAKTLAGGELTYSQVGAVPSSDLAKISTVILPEIGLFLNELAQDANSGAALTGNAVGSQLFALPMIVYAMIGLGIILLALLGYYLATPAPPQLHQAPFSPENAGRPSDSSLKTDAEKIRVLVLQSRNALERNDVREALQYYQQAMDAYRNAKLGLLEKFRVNSDINHAYEEIVVKSL